MDDRLVRRVEICELQGWQDITADIQQDLWNGYKKRKGAYNRRVKLVTILGICIYLLILLCFLLGTASDIAHLTVLNITDIDVKTLMFNMSSLALMPVVILLSLLGAGVISFLYGVNSANVEEVTKGIQKVNKYKDGVVISDVVNDTYILYFEDTDEQLVCKNFEYKPLYKTGVGIVKGTKVRLLSLNNGESVRTLVVASVGRTL